MQSKRLFQIFDIFHFLPVFGSISAKNLNFQDPGSKKSEKINNSLPLKSIYLKISMQLGLSDAKKTS